MISTFRTNDSLVWVGILCSVAVAASLWQQRKLLRENNFLKKEVDGLRKASKKKKSQGGTSEKINGKQATESSSSLEDDGQLIVKRVGTVRSIYRLCVGTPRQGLLAPNARGCIEMEKLGDTSTPDSVSGLEGYSHIWVLFVFHLNTESRNPKKIKSKIAPPALGGGRVGIYATRTPHRYNPIGITLCKLDSIRVNNKKQVSLEVSGLDLVDGTPVLDIKPYVPVYDSVASGNVKVPYWVAGGLVTKRRVEIIDKARNELVDILTNDHKSLQFYGPKYGESSVEETVDYACGCIEQVLAIDVRSSYQTKKSREGKFQAERSERVRGAATGETDPGACTQQLDNLLITYKVQEVTEKRREPSENSGAEDLVEVLSIKLIPKPS